MAGLRGTPGRLSSGSQGPSPGRAREWRDRSENVGIARQFVESALRREANVSRGALRNDILAVGALQAARRVGRKVPEEIAIVGFDDFDFARYVDPPLTTVSLPGYEMGHRAAELLLEYLQEGRFSQTETVFPTTLVPRRTA